MNDSVLMSLLEQAASRGEARPAEQADELSRAVQKARDALLAIQKPDGHWVFELEADATIPAEYVLMTHYLGEAPDLSLEAKIGNYLRRIQSREGGWALFYEGRCDVSASVKAYFALKMIGDDPDAAHMRRARELILAKGGAERSNVFTRILLALFDVISWRAVPVMPVEMVLLPRWLPLHLHKVSYWARTVVVPLLVLGVLRPKARNPRRVHIEELFVGDPRSVGMARKAPHQRWLWYTLFRGLDSAMRIAGPLIPSALRRLAIARAVAFVTERLNGRDGLGAIFPAMVNAVEMFDALGEPRDRPDLLQARAAIDRLLVVRVDEAYCQPCVSPVWDTSLMAHALLETGDAASVQAVVRGLEWLKPLQILEVSGDWALLRRTLRPGGWAFQYANPHYPDVDDTAVVAMAMDRAGKLLETDRYQETLARAREWIIGMQSTDGGWGAFEPENTHYQLNNIPFADHGALLDPPTADVSARCLSMLVQMGDAPDTHPEVGSARQFLLREQERDGSWYGRWGMNYVYGTWSALCALNELGDPRDQPAIEKAVNWLIQIQNADGGWGEHGDSYKLDYSGYEAASSTPSQTAWALLGLMAGGVADHPSVARGVRYLLNRQGDDGLWPEPHYTATGFPGVFYLRYHGYAKYFPLWALARYRNLKRAGTRKVAFGM
jgi:squalene-hopene/tetraprenyl-beta-curcumene cyclase